MNNSVRNADNMDFFKFKTHFKHLNFYSMPHSILFIVRKRLNLVFTIIFLFFFIFFSLL